ncbi:unnamed protein product [Adineta steineri]|uniref:Uncharacterized protein n=1 Tax=Adineta steineri TaxID=433720 RepID=A0A815BKG3_9BILA|nr:unnamed protein product [Adineta steineri]CAF3715843.1 unnamed protein product [Adineta steineri]
MYRTPSQLQDVFAKIVSNKILDSNHQCWFTQKRWFRNRRLKSTIAKYEHKVNFHTDGILKTIVSNGRELYCELRDDFKANLGFNLIVVTVISSYILTFLGRLFLEYKKDIREEKKMDRDYEFKLRELRPKQISDSQTKKESSVVEKLQVVNKK